MNISVKGNHALHAIFDLALQTGRAHQDCRRRALPFDLNAAERDAPDLSALANYGYPIHIHHGMALQRAVR